MNKLQIIALLLASSSAIRLQQKGIDGNCNPELGECAAAPEAPVAPAKDAKAPAAPAKDAKAPAAPAKDAKAPAAPAKDAKAPAKNAKADAAAPAKDAKAPAAKDAKAPAAKDAKAPVEEESAEDKAADASIKAAEAAVGNSETPLGLDDKAKSADSKSVDQKAAEKAGKATAVKKVPAGPCNGLNDGNCIEPYDKSKARYAYGGANPGDSQSLIQIQCNPDQGECAPGTVDPPVTQATPKPSNPPAAPTPSWGTIENGDSQSLIQTHGIDGQCNPELGECAPGTIAPPVTAPTPIPQNPPATKDFGWKDGDANGDSQSLVQKQGIDGKCNAELGECAEEAKAAPEAAKPVPAPAAAKPVEAPAAAKPAPAAPTFDGTINGDSSSLAQGVDAAAKPAPAVPTFDGSINGDSSSLAQGVDGKCNAELGECAEEAKEAPAKDAKDAKAPAKDAKDAKAPAKEADPKADAAAAKPADVAAAKPADVKPAAAKAAPAWNGTANGDSQSLSSVPHGMSETQQLADQHIDTGDVVLG